MKIAIVGGGASGLACAIECARKAKATNKTVHITVYEAKDRVGKKILATGNGRCNIFNANEDVSYFGDEAFAKYALSKYNIESNILFFSSMGLYVKKDSEGRYYPLSNQASGVLDALRFECERLGVKLQCANEINKIKKDSNTFDLGGGIKADKVVLACGGKAGVKGYLGYEILKQLGHRIINPTPALTKLNVADTKFVKQLKGIRHKGVLTLTCDGNFVAKEEGELLFTDYGLSGIAVMQLSSFVTRMKKGDIKISFDAVPDFNFSDLKEAIAKIIAHDKNMKCENLLSGFMPKKLGESIIKVSGISLNDTVGNLTEKNIDKIVSQAKRLTFNISGVRGFEDAQVTAGGADTKEFNPKTMESKKHKGLYCTGEILDVDGFCGGYNLWWAWSSGRLCGENLI